MSDLATQLTSACSSDLSLQNPQALQALAGLQAYAPLYKASCLKDPATSEYCFVEAVTNASAPASAMVYYLPLGVELPAVGRARVSCDGCLKRTMEVFAKWAVDDTQALHADFAGAVEVVDGWCGAGFVPYNGPVAAAAAQTGAGWRLRLSGAWWLGSFVVFAWVVL